VPAVERPATANNFTIELATIADAAACTELVRAGMYSYINPAYGIDQQALDYHTTGSDNQWEQRKNNVHSAAFAPHNETTRGWVVGSAGRTVLGFCIASVTGSAGYIDSLHIAKSFWGQGMGRKLASVAIDWLSRDMGTDYIQVGLVAYADAAIFYRRLGFEGAIQLPPSILRGGQELPLVEMRLGIVANEDVSGQSVIH
jgi:GNAT superfamily N-acetyltransferase